ncbi:glucosamine--fructose-6-phosphate aminotransferase (isomerizing) [Pseudochelatococcus lubricantis]|uniref:Glutamine--fructose-6-phosphate aminotransferase [isomerizing] n=1 Tax=Pseudochelatococcus lubricantis TaxID=1538102 RepID=A0ABX0V0U3_9HYPH|nr:glutamine--fructose-6-phosphate transaminase (isomerizing) [Pseudochelatococcus lubricantis]NIJ56721.1 glucosamine--fructose-6-phosphate aminotransferase (isomerizing) [Pseudochelatococcus lubricantis]
MCGIIAILGKSAVATALVDALKRLEYRGYDSAGVATLEDGVLTRVRAEGKLRNLEARLAEHPLHGHVGIGHTRWATHGRPTEINAHPHATGRVAVVHNGIIENFRELRDALAREGAVFHTQTDTEVVALLVDHALERGLSPVEAVCETLPRLKGAFALAFLFAGEEDLLIGARQGAPLAIGFGDGENYLGSDALALAPFTDRIAYLEDGDWAVLSRSAVTVYDAGNREVTRPVSLIPAGTLLADKGNYSHFMAKEIHEQPEVVGRTVAHYVDLATGTVRLPEEVAIDFAAIDRLAIAACGTAYYAGIIAKYWFEQLARLPVEIDVASEFRYREPPLTGRGLALFISQSGETADTLASLRYAKAAGWPALAVVNVATSTIARESDVVAPTLAGPEIGVASTKAFTCQLAVLLALAIHAGRARGVLSAQEEQELVDALVGVPSHMTKVLARETQVEQVARDLAKARDVLYLGRGLSYALALEGALKLKELSYIHAEGYAAGELKHGPIALIDEAMPVIVLAPRDKVFEKTVSNVQEVAARGGRIILIGDAHAAGEAGLAGETAVVMPEVHPAVVPLLYALPVQLLSYHTARVMGKDVDQPRNLAKSVTVE